MTRKALGRGLEALIPRQTADSAVRSGQATPEPPIIRLEKSTLPVDAIRPNPWQPRKSADPTKMEELVRSVQARGVLEPLLVRRVGEVVELVAGERRLRAAQRAGLRDVPVVFVDLDDTASLEVALVENVQRENLNPIDEARAYSILAGEFGKTHDEIAQQVSKDRSTITNLLRLLRLPDAVQDAVAQERISVGHARALLALPRSTDQEKWAQKILDEAWSVREAERRIQEVLRPTASGPPAAAQERDPHVMRVEEAVRRKVGTDVRLFVGRKGGGRLEFHYADQEDLERVLELLGVEIH